MIGKILCKLGIHDYEEVKKEPGLCGRCQIGGEEYPEIETITYKCKYCPDTFRRTYHIGYQLRHPDKPIPKEVWNSYDKTRTKLVEETFIQLHQTERDERKCEQT